MSSSIHEGCLVRAPLLISTRVAFADPTFIRHRTRGLLGVVKNRLQRGGRTLCYVLHPSKGVAVYMEQELELVAVPVGTAEPHAAGTPE